MQKHTFSLLIVSKNRKLELERTLLLLEKLIHFSEHEVLVFLDGCTDESEILKEKFSEVQWYSTEKSIIQNLEILKVYAEQNLLVVSGSIPGAKGSYVIVDK